MLSWLGSIEADPLAPYAVFKDSEIIHKLAWLIGLPYLPQHLHEILFFALVHFVAYGLTGPVLSSTTRWYRPLSRDQKVGLGVHVSSELNALLGMFFSFPLFFCPKLDSLVSYTPYAGFVAACMSGYFLFDTIMCIRDIKINGWGFAGHGIAAFFTFVQGSRPFMHNYSAPFIWFEASTTFVNIHWLASNIPGLISKQTETISGALLIIVFALCRIIPGPINGLQLFKVALTTDLPGVPFWVVLVILSCYSLLSLLNFWWFGKMLSVAYTVLFTKSKPIPVPVPVQQEVNKKNAFSSVSAARSTRRKRKV